MGGTAGLFERGHLVIQFLPFSFENQSTRDDDIDFLSAGIDGTMDFCDPFRHGRQPGREPGGDGSHVYPTGGAILTTQLADASASPGQSFSIDGTVVFHIGLDRCHSTTAVRDSRIHSGHALLPIA